MLSPYSLHTQNEYGNPWNRHFDFMVSFFLNSFYILTYFFYLLKFLIFSYTPLFILWFPLTLPFPPLPHFPITLSVFIYSFYFLTLKKVTSGEKTQLQNSTDTIFLQKFWTFKLADFNWGCNLHRPRVRIALIRILVNCLRRTVQLFCES